MITPLIRPAGPADDRALRELDNAVWSPLHSVQNGPKPLSTPFLDPDDRTRAVLVAEGEDGRIDGYVILGRPTPLPSNAHVRQIQGLAVAEEARGRGVARALLRAARQEAGRQGATRIALRVLGHNKPARALYEAEGFVVEGVLPGEFHLGGAYVDDVLMGRAVAD